MRCGLDACVRNREKYLPLLTIKWTSRFHTAMEFLQQLRVPSSSQYELRSKEFHNVSIRWGCPLLHLMCVLVLPCPYYLSEHYACLLNAGSPLRQASSRRVIEFTSISRTPSMTSLCIMVIPGLNLDSQAGLTILCFSSVPLVINIRPRHLGSVSFTINYS
jgi:hypothetical protein